MKKRFAKRSARWARFCVPAVLLVILAAVGLGSLYTKQVHELDTLLGGTRELVGESVEWGAEAAGTVGDFFSWLFSWRSVFLENAELKSENAQLRTQLSVLDEVREEEVRLAALDDYAAERPELTFTAAKVCLRDPSEWQETFTVDKGSEDGITADMAVVTADGLVGRVTEVFLHQAVVVTVLDPRNSVSVVVKRTRDEGIMKGADSGSGTEDLCTLHYLLYDASLLPGDEVLTSGLGGIYPEGIRVGTVAEVAENSVTVRPSADIGRLENVLIITGEAGEETP